MRQWSRGTGRCPRQVVDAMRWPRSSWCRGPDAGTTRWAARYAAALEDFDDDHAAAAARAWRAMVCRNGLNLIGVIAYDRRIGWRHGRGDQFSGTRDVGVAAGADEQPVVADAMEPLGQGV